jgi:hypothetical protein
VPILFFLKKRTKNISSARLPFIDLGTLPKLYFLLPVLFFLKKEPKTLALRGFNGF